MTDLAVVFPVAQEAALRASSSLQTAMGGQTRLYTTLPEDAPLPYVVIGEDQFETDDDGICAGRGAIHATVNIWTKPDPPSNAQARAIGAAVKAVLADDLALDGHEIVEWFIELETYSTDPDGSSRGRLIFH